MKHGLSSPFDKESNCEIKQKNVITYTMGLVLSNKYLKFIIKCQKPMIFDYKVELLFGYYRTEPQISLLKS